MQCRLNDISQLQSFKLICMLQHKSISFGIPYLRNIMTCYNDTNPVIYGKRVFRLNDISQLQSFKLICMLQHKSISFGIPYLRNIMTCYNDTNPVIYGKRVFLAIWAYFMTMPRTQ